MQDFLQQYWFDEVKKKWNANIWGKSIINPAWTFYFCSLYSHGKILFRVTSIPQESRPKLHANNAKDEEDEEAEKQHVAQHGESVKQQVHQDAHTCKIKVQ